MEALCTILVIDDDPHMCRVLRVLLSANSYTVQTAECGSAGLRMATAFTPDLIILDLCLPDMSGLDMCRELRGWYVNPILVLSVKDQDADKVSAFDLGADDYLVKPFSSTELLARLRALLRRTNNHQQTTETLTCGALHIDFIRRRVELAGCEVRLTPMEYDLLVFLARHRNRVCTHRMLMESVWDDTLNDDIRTLRVHISNLRKKIEPDPASPRYLLTESGVGFRFIDEHTC